MYRNSSFPSWEKLTATTGEAKYQNAIGQTNRPTSAQRPYLILVLLAFVFTDAFPPCFWCYCKNFAHYHFAVIPPLGCWRNSLIPILIEVRSGASSHARSPSMSAERLGPGSFLSSFGFCRTSPAFLSVSETICSAPAPSKRTLSERPPARPT